MPLAVVILPSAERQIAIVDRWWKANRETSNVIADELSTILDHLRRNPYLGPPAENARRPGLRRCYLGRIGYHLYYRVDEQRGQIRITAFRHARRRPVRI